MTRVSVRLFRRLRFLRETVASVCGKHLIRIAIQAELSDSAWVTPSIDNLNSEETVTTFSLLVTPNFFQCVSYTSGACVCAN